MTTPSNAVNILLDYKADPDIRDAVDRIALDYALSLPKNSKLKNFPALERLRKATKPKSRQKPRTTKRTRRKYKKPPPIHSEEAGNFP